MIELIPCHVLYNPINNDQQFHGPTEVIAIPIVIVHVLRFHKPFMTLTIGK